LVVYRVRVGNRGRRVLMAIDGAGGGRLVLHRLPIIGKGGDGMG